MQIHSMYEKISHTKKETWERWWSFKELTNDDIACEVTECCYENKGKEYLIINNNTRISIKGMRLKKLKSIILETLEKEEFKQIRLIFKTWSITFKKNQHYSTYAEAMNN